VCTGQVIKDYGCTFFKAALVPAANVHLSFEAGVEGPFLRKEVAAVRGLPPAERLPQRQQGGAEQVHLAVLVVCMPGSFSEHGWQMNVGASELWRGAELCLHGMWQRVESTPAAGHGSAAARPGSNGQQQAGSRATGSNVPKWMRVAKK
jgi:hypothetical protein